jgi:hypothetical protein
MNERHRYTALVLRSVQGGVHLGVCADRRQGREQKEKTGATVHEEWANVGRTGFRKRHMAVYAHASTFGLPNRSSHGRPFRPFAPIAQHPSLGYLKKGPIIVWERSIAIVAMVLCHVQLLLGFVIYAMRFKGYSLLTPRGKTTGLTTSVIRFWKYEHIAAMVLAIALVTLGRVLSKKAETEQGKQLRVAIFYLIALALMIAMIPWPSREGVGRAWL